MLAIYPATEIRKWDTYTIDKQEITSCELMEKAALNCSGWLIENFGSNRFFLIFCGNGNNGGDGLCIARHLASKGFVVYVCIIQLTGVSSADFSINLERLHGMGFQNFVRPEQAFNVFSKETNFIIVDALFGSGLNRTPGTEIGEIFAQINGSHSTIISIDIPSGMYADKMPEHSYIKATHTLCMQGPKLSAMLPITGASYGLLHILDIGLDPGFLSDFPPHKWFVEKTDIQKCIRPRMKFDYKSKFGHVLVAGGCLGMAGAVLFSARASLRSGCGLCTLVSVEENRMILQTALPEAIFCSVNQVDPLKYKVIVMGPGMGTSGTMEQLLLQVLHSYEGKLVLDADALNLIRQPEYFQSLKSETVITPHVGEFDRLFGICHSDFERLEKAMLCAQKLNLTIVLKGHYTAVISNKGVVYFNSSGNVGLAKGGSGDVLSGMVASFIAQGYPVLEACLVAVYLHGFTADLLLESMACESILASDIIETLPASFKKLKQS